MNNYELRSKRKDLNIQLRAVQNQISQRVRRADELRIQKVNERSTNGGLTNADKFFLKDLFRASSDTILRRYDRPQTT